MINVNLNDKTTKQVLVVRSDLKMPKGKIASQCAHASGKVFFDCGNIDQNDTLSINLTAGMKAWLTGSFTKVVCKVDSEQELLELYEKVKSTNVPCSLICDSGRTIFNGVPTYTVVAIGPDFNDAVDVFTSHLPLL